MALPNNPDRDSIYAEMIESTYVEGGGASELSGMYDYIFGAGTYDRDSFGGYGLATGSSLTATGGDTVINLSYSLDDLGNLDTKAVAQYWDNSQSTPPFTYSTQDLSTYSTTGNKNDTITNVNNGTNYDVRIIFINKFNNQEDYPNPSTFSPSYPTTNTDSASPQATQYVTPSVTSNSAVEDQSFKLYVEYSGADGQQDSIEIEIRINGGNNDQQSEPDYTCHTDLSLSSGEIITTLPGAVEQGTDTVEVRARAVGSALADSDWSTWTTISYQASPSCPL